jgi:hypothetical protein
MASAYRLIRNLHSRGNNILGAGCYAVALQSKVEDTVLKIGNNTDDLWLDYYAEIIKTHKDNQYVPIVKSLHIDYDNQYYVATMEKLYSIEDNEDAKNLLKDINSYIKRQLSEAFFRIALSKYPTLVPNVEAMVDLCFFIGELTSTEIDENEYEYEELFGVRKLDLHIGNAMTRKNGTLVITDPWCHVSTIMSDQTDLSCWLDDNISY